MRLKSHEHSMITMMTRKGIPLCISLTWIAILFLMTTAIVLAKEIMQRQVVGDVEIVLADPHAEGLPESSIESQQKHHLVIWLFDKATSNPIEGAQVNAGVAEVGYAKILKPMMVDGKPAYSGFFVMPGPHHGTD
jgi:hypothetical protein